MSPADSVARASPSRAFSIAVAILIAADCIVPAFYHDLWNPDEPRLAHLGRRMVREGDWLIPSVNGEVFIEQPPLQAWSIALASAVFGHGYGRDWIPRIPSILFTLATLWLVHRHGRRYRGERVGWLAPVLLLATIQFQVSSHRAVTDTSLTFFVTLGMLQLVEALAERESGPLALRRALLLGLATGFSFLSKNLVGVVFLGLVWTALALRHPSTFRGAVALRRLLLGGLVAVAVPSPWLIAVGQERPDLLHELLVDNTIGRFFSEGKHNPPWYEFLHRGAGVLMPFLPLAIVLAYRRLRGRAPESGGRGEVEGLLWWIVLPFVLIQLSGSKREIYLLPLTPAVALAGAIQLDSWRQKRALVLVSRWLIRASTVAITMLGLIGGVWTAGPLPWPVWGFLVVQLGLVWRWLRGGRGEALPTAVLALLTTLGGFSIFVYSIRNEGESYVDLCRYLERFRREGYAIVGVELPLRETSAIPYYLDEDIAVVSRSGVADYLGTDAAPAVLVIRAEREVPGGPRHGLPEALADRDSTAFRVRRAILVIPNRPRAEWPDG